MSQLAAFTQQMESRRDLTPAEVAIAAHELAAPEIPEDIKAGFLSTLAVKGETAAEVASFAREFRARAVDPGVSKWSAKAIDIVGTGGDHAGGFNISTLVVVTLAAAGATVMKHGNRGITSKCGSADLFAALGVNLEAPADKLRAALDELGFVFFFAPGYHPAFKHIAPVRKALAAKGQRSIFNILGPLINPGRPAHVLLGVFSEAWVPRLADALEELGAEAGLAAHGRLGPDHGIDELTTTTANRVRGFGRLRSIDGEWRGEDHGFVSRPFEDLLGGDVSANLAIVEAILAGRAPPGLVDTIVFNTAAALWILGRVGSVREGAVRARELLLGGAVKAKLAATKEFYRS